MQGWLAALIPMNSIPRDWCLQAPERGFGPGVIVLQPAEGLNSYIFCFQASPDFTM